jgi:hypothetical protein
MGDGNKTIPALRVLDFGILWASEVSNYHVKDLFRENRVCYPTMFGSNVGFNSGNKAC